MIIIDQAKLKAKQDKEAAELAQAELASIHLASIPLILSYLSAKPDAKTELKVLEARAVAIKAQV